MRRFLIVNLSVLALCQTHANGSPHEAEQHYAAGDFEKAVRAYKNAYEQSGEPQLLLKLADAQRRLGRFSAAKESYRRFVRLSSAGENGRLRARRMLTQLESVLAQQKLREQHESKIAIESTLQRSLTPVAPDPVWERAGFYGSIGITLVSGAFFMYHAAEVAQLEDDKELAWSQLAALDSETYSTLAGNQVVVSNACADARSLAQDSSSSLQKFVTVCNRGQRAARLASFGQIGMLAGLVSSAYLGYRLWNSPQESGSLIVPSIAIAPNGGVQGSVSMSF